jgi:hypothetical protein
MAGSGKYKICLQSDGVGALATIDIDPSRAIYVTVAPTEHKQDGTPVYQGFDSVDWEFDYITDSLVDQLRPLVGEAVYIKTRLADKYAFGNKKAYLDDFATRPSGRGWLSGKASFVKVEDV